MGWDFAKTKFESNGIELDDVTRGLSLLLVVTKIGVTERKEMLPKNGFLSHRYLPYSVGTDFRSEITDRQILLLSARISVRLPN